jgi:phage baseplate assembly protein gpV
MQPFELFVDDTETQVRNFHGGQALIWTMLPGIIQSFNPTQMTCTVSPSIKAKLFTPDGLSSDVALPLLVDCPVQFPSGGGFTLTFPIKLGDECMIHFASRCIDNWWYLGGVQAQAEMRMHDLSDGFIVPKVWSLPNVINSISTATAQLRSDDGSTYVDIAAGVITVKAASVIVNSTTATVNASGGATVNANTQVNGNLIVSGDISDKNGASGTLQHVRDNYNVHTHTDPQGGITGGPSNSL